MLTENTKRLICQCLSPTVVKYTVNGGFYWKKEEQRFVVIETYDPYIYFAWHTFFYMEIGLVAALLAFLYDTACASTIPETYEVVSEYNQRLMLCLVVTLFVSICSGILISGSIQMDYRQDLAHSLTQTFKWTEQLRKKLGHTCTPPSAVAHQMKQMEKLVKFCTCLPLVLPILFVGMAFHPLDPVRKFRKWLLDYDFGLNLETGLLIFLEVVAVNMFIGIVMGIVMTLLTLVSTIKFSLEMALPYDRSTPITRQTGNLSVKTAHIGQVNEDDLIWLCRSLQVARDITYAALSTSRIAFHYAMLQITGVVSVFALIRMTGIMLDGTLTGLSMLGLIVAGALLSVFIILMECFLLESLEVAWNSFAENVRKGFGRNCRLRKVVRSMRPLTVRTAGPYFNVNKSTFLEWANTAVDYLVNLLVTL